MKEAERSARQRDLEREQDEHKRQMEREAHKDKMIEEKELSEATINDRRMAIGLGKEKVRIEKERLDGLKALDVDVTQVLVAECKLPDKTLRVENTDGATALHVHEEFGKNRE